MGAIDHPNMLKTPHGAKETTGVQATAGEMSFHQGAFNVTRNVLQNSKHDDIKKHHATNGQIVWVKVDN